LLRIQRLVEAARILDTLARGHDSRRRAAQVLQPPQQALDSVRRLLDGQLANWRRKRP
jgi:hypothetical protein